MSRSSLMSESEEKALHLPSVYDGYLCTEPAGGVPLLIRNGPDEYTASMRTLQRSADYFAERDQLRAVERLQWEMAKVHMQHEQWERAVRVLTPLWQTLSWRKAGWWKLLEEVDWALQDCASRTRNLETLIAVDWELFSNSLTPRQEFTYDFSNILRPFEPLNSRPKSVVKAENILSCVSLTFAFSTAEGNVGVNLQSQVVISSRAQDSSKFLVLSKIRVAFGGNLKNLIIHHDPSQAPRASAANGLFHIYQVPLQKASPESSLTPSSPPSPTATRTVNDLTGLADLTIAPGATKAFLFDHVPRDAEDVDVASLTFCIHENEFDLDVIVTEDEQMHQDVFWLPSKAGPVKKTLKTERSSAVKILPKPPKMRVETRNVTSTYYTDEAITVGLWIMNEEDEEASVTLEARVVGSGGLLPSLTWKSPQGFDQSETENTLDKSQNWNGSSISRAISSLASSSDQSHDISLQLLSEAAEYVVEVRARYYLISDPDTPISKFSSARISVQLPFEISHSLTPMINHKPWPSYFDVHEYDKNDGDDPDGNQELANGLSQTWKLTSRLYSLASEPLHLENVHPRIIDIHEAAICNIAPSTEDTSKLTLIPSNELQERDFILKAQKTDLEDRRSAFLDLRMEISWRRKDSEIPPTVTHLPVPELVIPFGEPRVLAIARNGEIPQGVIYLHYVIENPSSYPLTFNLTMEPSEEFAFSGPKNVSVKLLPLSRHSIRYNLMPLVRGTWISPQLKVFDTHFHKALKVSGTEGMRSDKKGLSVWVDADG